MIPNNIPNDRLYQLEQGLAHALARTETLTEMMTAERAAFVAFAGLAGQRQAELMHEIATLRGRIDSQNNMIEDQYHHIEEQNAKINAQDALIASQYEHIKELNTRITSSEAALAERIAFLQSVVVNHKHAVKITFPNGGKCSFATTKIGGHD